MTLSDLSDLAKFTTTWHARSLSATDQLLVGICQLDFRKIAQTSLFDVQKSVTGRNLDCSRAYRYPPEQRDDWPYI